MNLQLITRFLFLFFFLLGVRFLAAQAPLYLKGKVWDAETEKPLPYATIRICGTNYGALSNERGEFQVYIGPEEVNDSLCITSIGYATGYFPLAGRDYQEIQVFSLTSSPYTLGTIQIEDEQGKLPSAKQLVRRSLRRIDQNYPQDSFFLQGYYRDYVRKDSGYLNLFEAALRVWDPGFTRNALEHAQVEVLQTRFREEVARDERSQGAYKKSYKFVPSYDMPSYGGNEFSILEAHDPIRNHQLQSFSFVYRIVRDFVRNHTFTLDSIVMQDDVPLYQIGFVYKVSRAHAYSSLRRAKNNPIRGRIWIRSDNYAIVRFEYLNFFENQTPPRKRYEIVVEYQELQGKMFLKYISMNNYFSVEDSVGVPFQLAETEAVTGEDQLLLRFNRPVESGLADRASLFEVFYKDQPLLVSRSELVEPFTVRLTIPRLEALLRDDRAIVQYLDDVALQSLIDSQTLNIRPNYFVRDTTGSYYGRRPFISLYQYREFFVNAIDTRQSFALSSQEFMDKNKPLYEQQRRTQPGFWSKFTVMLNTPLKEE